MAAAECVQLQVDTMVLNCVKDAEDALQEKVFKRKYYCKNNKRKKQQPFSDSDVFKFTDYDCIGFDLDNTVCRYKIGNLMRMEYKYIAEYLVYQYGYDKSLLLPLDEDLDFIQKGLVLDIKRGNFLKVAPNGRILRATHGTRPMTRSDIVNVYGESKCWEPVVEFSRTLYDNSTANSNIIRSFKDYFDLPSAVACARAIDAEDRNSTEPPLEYDVWRDVHVAMCSLYRKENFKNNIGGFFPEMKEFPEKYIYEASDRLRKWLKAINEHTFTFLITGSSIDYASHAARFTLGPDWREYFDMMICTARKPGFFTDTKPFISLKGTNDGKETSAADLTVDGTYAGGNWSDLYNFVKRESDLDNPHCLYVGDHLCQDVLTPAISGIDTVAVVEELAAEGMVGDPMEHDSGSDLMSMYWGSFFTTEGDKSVFGIERINTLFGEVPVKFSRLAIPTLEVLARHPIRHPYTAFTTESSGFYPGDPVILHF